MLILKFAPPQGFQFPCAPSNHVRVSSTNFIQRSSKYNIKNNENSVTAAVGSSEQAPTFRLLSRSRNIPCATRYCEPATAGQVSSSESEHCYFGTGGPDLLFIFATVPRESEHTLCNAVLRARNSWASEQLGVGTLLFRNSSDSVRHSDDALSVEAWVEKERRNDEKSCVILYKPKGVDMAEYPQLKTEDFMLGIMTEAQNNVAHSGDSALHELNWYNSANKYVLDQLSEIIRQTSVSGVWRLLIAYKNILCAVENFSIASVYGLYYFVKGNLGLESFSMFVRYDSLAQDYLAATQHFSLVIYEDYERFRLNFPQYKNMTIRRLEIYSNASRVPNFDIADEYYSTMTLFLQELRGYQEKIHYLIR
ncbi:hypothetical protein ANN_19355 [Periplaneta americana]|uniref:Nitrate/nitrite sensing protein domain-containing protein n=1 Tax=Periplaneta americana TaxID=6978 RepID=A0ABQ8S9R0_PERAM|nr:hypothetical protein ANN_19355 [Periplaneta americana]